MGEGDAVRDPRQVSRKKLIEKKWFLLLCFEEGGSTNQDFESRYSSCQAI